MLHLSRIGQKAKLASIREKRKLFADAVLIISVIQKLKAFAVPFTTIDPILSIQAVQELLKDIYIKERTC